MVRTAGQVRDGDQRAVARLGVLRARDTSTAEGRGAERHRRLALTAVASAAARGLTVLASLISIPLTLHYLGPERYGVWITISTFSALLAFADLGIGNGLLTMVARASGRDDWRDIRVYISSAGVALTLIGAAVMVCAVLLSATVDWTSFFNVSNVQAQGEVRAAVLVFLICFALSLPLTMVQRVQLALQRGFLTSLWQCAASLATLLLLLLALALHAPLPWLVGVFVGTPLAAGLLNSLLFFGVQARAASPTPALCSRRHIGEVMKSGGLFFTLQIAIAAAFACDPLLITRLLGPEAVAPYSIADRLFSLVGLVVGLGVLPLWPAFGEALTRGDTAWANRTLVRATLLAGTVAIALSAALLIGSSSIIHLWIGGAQSVPFTLLAGMATWRITEALANPSAMYLNAINALRIQVITALILAATALGLKIMLLPLYGVPALPWITVGCYIVTCGVPMALYVRRRLRADGRAEAREGR